MHASRLKVRVKTNLQRSKTLEKENANTVARRSFPKRFGFVGTILLLVGGCSHIMSKDQKVLGDVAHKAHIHLLDHGFTPQWSKPHSGLVLDEEGGHQAMYKLLIPSQHLKYLK